MAAAKKEEKKNIKTSTSSGHSTNLKQFILETFDIYGGNCCELLTFDNKVQIWVIKVFNDS